MNEQTDSIMNQLTNNFSNQDNKHQDNEHQDNEHQDNEHQDNKNQINKNQINENQDKQQAANQSSILEPPVCVSGLKELDRDKFSKQIQVTCLKVKTKELKSILKVVKQYLLKKPNFHPVVKLDDEKSIIYLNPDLSGRLIIEDQFIKLVKDYNIELVNKEVTLNYDNFNQHEILKAILYADNLSIASFSLIGHIIHLNLKDDFEPYKKVIGQVLLDKNPSQDLVLNKLNKIDSVYRYFEFDILAKRNESTSTVVQVSENGLKFKMDFAKVYWNPRLSTEHQRIIELLNDGDIVYDVFAGIGPFAIPAAKEKQCQVFANDLNPESFNYLNENIKLNKILENLKAFNMDGRDFINEIVRENLIESWLKFNSNKNEIQNKVTNQKQFHIIMNLPAIAVEFLDTFVGLTEDKLNDDQTIADLYKNDRLIMPTIYCYCFHVYDQDKNKIITDVKNRLKNDQIGPIDLFFVRKVAPAKEMYRITFKLSKEILFAQKANKKMKISH